MNARLTDAGSADAKLRLSFIGLREPALEDGDGHAQENRVAQETERPDAEANQGFIQRRRVFDDLARAARE